MTEIADGRTQLHIKDGRVEMSVDGQGTLHVQTADHKPLSKAERHLTLKVVGDDVVASIDLDAAGLDALADAVYHAQEDE